MTRKVLINRASKRASQEIVLGAGLEPASLSAYAPQTYVSAIPPPERREGQTFRRRQPLASVECILLTRARARNRELSQQKGWQNEISTIRD